MKKKMVLANFNIVFINKETEEPMLEYFDNIIYPAFTSEIIKKSKDTEYLLKNVEVLDLGGEDYALVGNIVKKTVLEVKSNLDENMQLIEEDNKYPTAPFSSFCIYLKNHRMLYVHNQKGSPDLKSFKATIYYIINKYIGSVNKELRLQNKETLPIPIINVVGIPLEHNIKQVLGGIKKVNRLTLKFYPLNGDIDLSGMFGNMTTELRKRVGSKNGEVVLKSPDSIDGIAEVLEQAGGTVEPVFNVTYPNKSTATIKNDSISERLEIETVGSSIEEELAYICKEGKNMNTMTYTNDSHNNIYNKNKSKVIPFVRRQI